jgi:hypothetical protein
MNANARMDRPRTYSMGTGAYAAKFALNTETRSIYLRAWYWTFRRAPRARRLPFVTIMQANKEAV